MFVITTPTRIGLALLAVSVLSACGGGSRATTSTSGTYTPTATAGACPIGDWALTGDPLLAFIRGQSDTTSNTYLNADGNVTLRLDNQHAFTLTFNGTRANFTAAGTPHATTIGGAIEGTYTTKASNITLTPTTATLFAATDGAPIIGPALKTLNDRYTAEIDGSWAYACSVNSLSLTNSTTSLTFESA